MADNVKEVDQTPPPPPPQLNADDNRRRTRSQTRNGGVTTPPAVAPESRGRKRGSQSQPGSGGKRGRKPAQPAAQVSDEEAKIEKETEVVHSKPAENQDLSIQKPADDSSNIKAVSKTEEKDVCSIRKPTKELTSTDKAKKSQKVDQAEEPQKVVDSKESHKVDDAAEPEQDKCKMKAVIKEQVVGKHEDAKKDDCKMKTGDNNENVSKDELEAKKELAVAHDTSSTKDVEATPKKDQVGSEATEKSADNNTDAKNDTEQKDSVPEKTSVEPKTDPAKPVCDGGDVEKIKAESGKKTDLSAANQTKTATSE